MEMIFTRRQFLFKGKVRELAAFLQENAGRYRTLQEFLAANLN